MFVCLSSSSTSAAAAAATLLRNIISSFDKREPKASFGMLHPERRKKTRVNQETIRRPEYVNIWTLWGKSYKFTTVRVCTRAYITYKGRWSKQWMSHGEGNNDLRKIPTTAFHVRQHQTAIKQPRLPVAQWSYPELALTGRREPCVSQVRVLVRLQPKLAAGRL